MSERNDPRREAVQCAERGAIATARVRSDGSILPIASDEICDCPDSSLHVISADGAIEDSGP